jgi:UDP-N-acetylmuramoyl-L-alanyl-D-glutamate--2,6-diaminopimelate ligase
MKLRELLFDMPVKAIRGSDSALDQEVAGITKDSRDVREGHIFFATGSSKAFLANALGRNALAIVTNEPPSDDVPCLIVADDVRYLLARMASKLYGFPSRDLFVTGITGTNGKTTITYVAESIVKAAGKRAGVIGTISYRYSGHMVPAKNTTPESSELQSLFGSMRAAGCDHAIMEVSSHALDQGRVEAIDFDCAVFTNLTHDHLDYHGDFWRYREAKALLFHHFLKKSSKEKKWAIINIDDPVAPSLIPAPPVRTMTYSTRIQADAGVISLAEDIEGLTLNLSLNGARVEARSPMVGLFNVSNILAASLFGVAAGISADDIKRGIEELPGVPGRLERIRNNRNIHVFIDYAHTPDALKKTIETLNHVRSGRLIVVFGCGGDRDRTKRPVMGKIAAEMADFAVVTSDNPRTEQSLAIIDEIRAGINGTAHAQIEDRRTAIAEALAMAKEDDVVLVAGKGHEDYQIIGTTKYPFSDNAVVKELLSVGG